MKNIILGAEGIAIHGNKIVLGMQKQKRWYFLENGEKAAIIKTLGGAVEKVDENNTRKTLIREILEEVKEINNKDIKVSKQPVFTKEIEIRELNPYEQNSTLKMRADFYTVEIAKDINLKPNDLPALIEIPKEKFYDIKLASNLSMKYIKDYNKLIKKDFLKKYCDFVIKNIELIDSHTKQILLQKIRDYIDELNIYGDSDYYIIDSSLEKANKESLKSMQSVEINLSEEFVKEMEEKINFQKKIYLKLDCNERIQKLLSELSPINIIETKKYIEESKGAFASAFKEHIVDLDGKVINYNDLDETQMLSLKANEYINIMMRLYFACIIRPFYSSPINEDEVKKSIYNILTNSKLVSSDRIDSLLDSFVALLKQDFKASIYDIVEEFEESLRYYFKNEKMNIYKRNAKRDLIGLSNIFNDHKINTYRDRLYETIDENYYFTLKWFLVDNYGFGLKNKISHRYKAKDLYNTTYAIYSAFQILRFYWGFQNN